MNIWTRTKAHNYYEELLCTIDWDEEARRIIEKNKADEERHIGKWKRLLGEAELAY